MDIEGWIERADSRVPLTRSGQRALADPQVALARAPMQRMRLCNRTYDLQNDLWRQNGLLPLAIRRRIHSADLPVLK